MRTEQRAAGILDGDEIGIRRFQAQPNIHAPWIQESWTDACSKQVAERAFAHEVASDVDSENRGGKLWLLSTGA